MEIAESFGSFRGHLRGEYRKEEEVKHAFSKPNVITYAAADIMARLLGGDSTYAPGHIGFIYGGDDTMADLVDPASLSPATKRVHTWSTITAELTTGLSQPANILICPLTLNPGYTVDGSSTTYSGNAITLAAQTGLSLEYGMPNSVPYAAKIEDLVNCYFYQVLLLNRRVVNGSVIYTPFSRVNLTKVLTKYVAKPAGFDLAVFWTISYV